jgi:hypothetical protein
VISVWFGQVRQTARCRSRRIIPGSAFTKSLRIPGVTASHRWHSSTTRVTSAGSPRAGICRGQTSVAAGSRPVPGTAPVLGHLFVVERAQDPGRQDLLHEDVVLQDHVLAAVRAERLEQFPGGFRPLVPGLQRRDDRLHVGDRPHRPGVAAGPVEAQGAAPVVHDQGDVVGDTELFQQRVQEVMVPGEGVVGRVLGPSLSASPCRSGRGNHAPQAGHGGNDVAPDAGRGRFPCRKTMGAPSPSST